MSYFHPPYSSLLRCFKFLKRRRCYETSGRRRSSVSTQKSKCCKELSSKGSITLVECSGMSHPSKPWPLADWRNHFYTKAIQVQKYRDLLYTVGKSQKGHRSLPFTKKKMYQRISFKLMSYFLNTVFSVANNKLTTFENAICCNWPRTESLRFYIYPPHKGKGKKLWRRRGRYLI